MKLSRHSKIVILTGPTASGKTALAIKLARRFGGEIISADSRQVYWGMNIGTSKSSKNELKSVPHHLIDIRNPNGSYTLAHFRRDALKVIKQIQNRGHIPFLVGGTPFYISALVNNLQIPEVKPNLKLRRKLEKLPVTALFKMLKSKDPARAKSIDSHNKRRLIRALEIIEVLGNVPSPSLGRVPEGRGSPKSYSVLGWRGRERSLLILGIKKSDSALRRSINHRTEQMLRAGLVRETKKLIRKYGRRKLFVDTIGYAEIIQYLDGQLTLAEAKKLITLHTYQFTRRQLTWFRRLPIHWIKNQQQAIKQINTFLKK